MTKTLMPPTLRAHQRQRIAESQLGFVVPSRLAPYGLRLLTQVLLSDPQFAAVAPKSGYLSPPEAATFDSGRIAPEGYTENIGVGELAGRALDQADVGAWPTGCAIPFSAVVRQLAVSRA